MLTIRLATPADHAALVVLMTEMQAHYQVPCPTPAAIQAGLESRPAGAELIVAEEGGRILGFAAFAGIYPGPGLNPGFFLKELYVSAASRGSGAGRALMQALARLAVERGFRRVDWTAARGDLRLRRFYDALGAEPHEEKIFYRLTGEALEQLARSE